MEKTLGIYSQFQSGNDLSLTPSEKIWTCVLFMYACIGEIGSLLVIISTLRQNISPSTLFLLSLSVADWMYNTQTLIVTIGNLLVGGWAFQKTGAKVFFFNAMISIICSGTSLVLITIERYLAIFYRKNISKKQATAAVAFTWILSLFVSLIPTISGHFEDSILLSTSKLYCSFNFQSHRPEVLAVVISILCFLCIYMNIIIYVYYRIVTFYLEQKKHKTKKLSDREKQLIRKALIICSAFILCWIPISVTIVYQEITLQPVNSNVDALSSLLTTTNAVINPYLLILLDARIKQNVYTMLGIPYEVQAANHRTLPYFKRWKELIINLVILVALKSLTIKAELFFRSQSFFPIMLPVYLVLISFVFGITRNIRSALNATTKSPFFLTPKDKTIKWPVTASECRRAYPIAFYIQPNDYRQSVLLKLMLISKNQGVQAKKFCSDLDYWKMQVDISKANGLMQGTDEIIRRIKQKYVEEIKEVPSENVE